MLRTSIPVPTSSSIESATWATTRLLPSGNRPGLVFAVPVSRPYVRSAVADVGACRAERGDQPDEQRGSNRQRGSKGEHRRVEVYIRPGAAWATGGETQQRGASPPGDQEARGRTGSGQHGAFRKELLHEANATGTESDRGH